MAVNSPGQRAVAVVISSLPDYVASRSICRVDMTVITPLLMGKIAQGG